MPSSTDLATATAARDRLARERAALLGQHAAIERRRGHQARVTRPDRHDIEDLAELDADLSATASRLHTVTDALAKAQAAVEQGEAELRADARRREEAEHARMAERAPGLAAEALAVAEVFDRALAAAEAAQRAYAAVLRELHALEPVSGVTGGDLGMRLPLVVAVHAVAPGLATALGVTRLYNPKALAASARDALGPLLPVQTGAPLGAGSIPG